MQWLKKLSHNRPDFFPLIALFLVYSAGHGLILLNDAVLWDDWHWQFFSMKEAVWQYVAQSQPFYALVYWICHSITSSHYFFRAITFVLFFLISVLFYKILCRSKKFTGDFSDKFSSNFPDNFPDNFQRWPAFFTAALFAVLPQYFSRLCFGMLTYTLSLFLFTWAFYLVIAGYYLRTWLWRGLTLSLFFLSFTLASLIWLYLIPCGYLYFSFQEPFKFSVRKIVRFSIRHMDFILLPFVFVVSHKIFFPKLAQFAGYNAITWEGFLESRAFLWKSIRIGFIDLLRRFWGKKIVLEFLILFIAGVVIQPALALKKSIHWVALALASFLFFCFSVFPYSIVGRAIDHYYIEDRNAILTLFFLALFFFSALSAFFSFTRAKWSLYLALGILTFTFAKRSFEVNLSCLQGMIKQDALMARFAEMPEIRDGRTFYVDDHATDYAPNDTPYEQSQLTGLVRAVYKTPNRCVSDHKDDCRMMSDWVLKRNYYSLYEYQPDQDRYQITLDYGPLILTDKRAIFLALMKIFDRSLYRKTLPETLKVTVRRL